MAFEAARQLSSPGQIIAAYTVREVHIRRALIVPQGDDGVEVQVHLRPLKQISDNSTSWNDFQIYAYDDGAWSETCAGQVAVEYLRQGETIIEPQNFQRNLEELRAGTARCCINMASDRFYRSVQNHGLVFGPCFQTLNHIRFN
jgi:hypothetical protein